MSAPEPGAGTPPTTTPPPAAATPTAATPPAAGTYLTVDAVWTGRRFLGETTFRFDGERLHPLGEDDRVPARSRHLRIDGTLFPRLTDHHVHLGLTDQHAVFAGGITHAIDLGWVPAVAAGWLTDDLTRPSVAIVGSLLTCRDGYPVNAGWGPPGSSTEVGGEREARLAVRANVMLGASRIKVTLNTEAGETVDDRVLLGIVREAHAQGVPVTVHVQGEGQTARAVAAGADQLAHTPFTERVDDDLIAECVRRGVTWVSTLDIHGWGEPTEQHGIASENLGRFSRVGGHVLYGTDLGNGPLAVGVNARELRGMLDAGVSADAVLRSIGGLRRPDDGTPPTIGARAALIPSAPPSEPDALPDWLATARGLTAARLADEAASHDEPDRHHPHRSASMTDFDPAPSAALLPDPLTAARALDAADPLAPYRRRFAGINDESSTVVAYFDGNSLGRPTRASIERIHEFLVDGWGGRLIRGWDEEWMELPFTIGDELGRVALGAAAGQTFIGDSTTVLLYKLARAAVDSLPERSEIVLDTDNFPTDRYLLDGIARERGLRLVWIEADTEAGVTPEQVAAAVGPRTALVVLSHVAYRSGFLADLASITRIVHDAGALVLWDLCHSVGSVPVELDAADVDLAVGCTYKYLNGGPGSPAFGYVNERLIGTLTQPIQGWMGVRDVFLMGPEYVPADGVRRFLSGTPPVVGMLAMRDTVEMIGEAGIDAVRAKSVALTEFAVALADEWLTPLGVTLASPRDPDRRGGHITLSHPAMRQVTALLWQRDVIPDYRDPDGLRVGLSPLSTSFEEVCTGMAAVRDALGELAHD